MIEANGTELVYVTSGCVKSGSGDLAARLKAIYSSGDTVDPMELYRAFRGRDPQVAPLLAQRGLAA